MEIDQEERRKTLREEAEAMRRRLEQLDGKISSVTATTVPTSPVKDKSTISGVLSETKAHDAELLRKKLKKVEKMIAKEAPGTKEYKKLQKKRAEYRSQLDDMSDSDDPASSSAVVEAEADDRKEQLRLQARRKREEAENAAAEKLQLQRDAEAEERRRKREEEQAAAEAAEEQERQRKEAIREEARRLREEAIEKKRREEEQAEEAERQRKEAIREEARRIKEEAMKKKRREEEAAEEEECRKKQARLEEARRLKEEALEKKRKEEEAAAKLTAAPYETDEQKRKQAFLEEARALKQAAMEKKRKEEEETNTTILYESDEQKRKEAFLEEARALKAAAMAKKEAEEADAEVKEKQCQAEAEAEEEERRARAVEVEQERALAEAARRQQMEAQRQQDDVVRRDAEQERAAYHQQEASSDFLDRRALQEPFSDNTKKILRELENMENRHKKLEKSLVQNGIPVSEDIPYEVAKDKIAEISDSMRELASAEMDPYATEKKYNYLEEQLAKYTTAMMLTDEYAEEQKRIDQEWEDFIEADNIVALKKIWSHMPVNVKSMTEDDLSSTPSPNGKTLPISFARKFKRTNVLQLLRVNPNEIEKMHPSLLEGIRTTGLTLTERKAIHEHLRDVGDRWQDKIQDPSCEKKFQWFQNLKMKFQEVLNAYTSHVEKYGPPGNHPYAQRNNPGAGGCPMLGNQCPLKADAVLDYSDDYGYPQEAVYESGAASSSTTRSPRRKGITVHKSSKPKASESEIMDELRERLCLDSHETDVDKKLMRELFHAEKRTRSLEKQLTQAGLALPQEDISFSVAKTKVAELTEDIKGIAAKMSNTSDSKEITRLEIEFGRISQELDKYNNAMMLTKEWAQEQEDKERQWEASVAPANYEALQKIWRHMPVNIRDLSEEVLSSAPTPNGKTLCKAMAKKFKRTNILMLLRLDPNDIEPMHPSSLEAMRTTGLTLTERRALHEHLKTVAPKWQLSTGDKMCERKWMWHASLKSKFKEMLEKYDQHVEQYGPASHHPYASRNDPGAGGCPLLGNQCPVKADLASDYNDDYGFPDCAVYMKENIAKSKLLTMEDIERRKMEDEMEYGGYEGAAAPVPSSSSQDPVPAVGHMGIGMMSAIHNAPKKESISSTDSGPPPARPKGGLMAELGEKTAKNEAEDSNVPAKRPLIGGLMAELQRKASKK
jgi:hypothetical protein